MRNRSRFNKTISSIMLWGGAVLLAFFNACDGKNTKKDNENVTEDGQVDVTCYKPAIRNDSVQTDDTLKKQP